jgi:very-short-patch-repair endonuclease
MPPMAKSSSFSVEEADPSEFGGRILKKKTRERVKSDQQKIYDEQQRIQKQNDRSFTQDGQGQYRDAKGRIIFTKPERNLMDIMRRYQEDGIIKYNIVPQFPVRIGNAEYPLDFGIGELKLGIEADGETFHSSPEQAQKDQERDKKLNQAGWTILRFTDDEIEHKGEQVMRSIVKSIMEKEMFLKKISLQDGDAIKKELLNNQ